MSRVSYKSLFQLFTDEMDKRLSFNTLSTYQNQSGRVSISPITSSGRSDANTAELVTAIQNLLSESLPSTIIDGLVVTASSPISQWVNISSGSGAVGGFLYSLSANTQIRIPMDISSSIFYIVLYKDRILVERTYDSKKLTIAKVVIPNPGVTSLVQDTKDSSWNAYIVNFKEYKLYGYNNVLEDDSIELLRDNMGQILADNIIGNIRLNEDLKITNTAGTLELDSNSMKLKDLDLNLLAKFNSNGVYFYNTDGIEMARFTNIDARVGNIKITKNSIQSTNFTSGALGSGFQILDSGDAEFNNIRARGKLTSSVFEKETVSSIGGNLLISDSDILDLDMSSLDSSTLTITGDTTFAVGDILRIKDGIDDEWFEVTSITLAPIYAVNRDKAGAYISNNNPIWKKGTAVINYGGSGKGLIYMTASESNSPYFSVVTHAGDPWSTLNTQVRIGNLNGFLDYLTNNYGIGIGSVDSYLKYDPINGLRIKGSVIITGGSTTITTFRQSATASGWGIPTSTTIGDLWMNTDSGRLYRAAIVGANQIISGEWEESQTAVKNSPGIDEGLYLGSDIMGYFSGSDWTSYIDNNGNFYFGSNISGDTSHFISWNGSTLCIRGDLNANDIKAGSLSLSGPMEIRTTELVSGSSYNRTVFDSYGIKSYDHKDSLKLNICDGHIEAQDIKLQDPLCSCCYSYLDAGRLKFHDTLGDVPYVTRICSGTAATGGKITLVGWNYAPEITVGIKELISYNPTQSAACQKWVIYNDAPVCFYTSAVDFGYCFLVHACLITAVSTGSECIRGTAMDACILSGTGVCEIKVNMQFQLWCNNNAPSNYYYGTLCYAICYRCNGSGTWCACCYCYAQPHASLAQITTTTNHCVTLTLPCGACWQIMPHAVSLVYTDSGICASTANIACCLCTITIANACVSALYRCGCNPIGCTTCTCTLTFTGLPSTNVYCSVLFWTLSCSPSLTAVSTFCTATGRKGYSCASYTDCAGAFTISSVAPANCQLICQCALPGTQRTYGSGAAVANMGFSSMVAAFLCCGTNTCQYALSSVCAMGICQNICYCCVTYSGACALCNYQCLYSTTDTFAAQCILDPAGCVNWLAISYN